MAQIEEILLPIDESLQQLVKLEPPDLDDELNPCNASNSIDGTKENVKEEKVGEIYRVSLNCLKFVCIHCSHEFASLKRFTDHIEKHLLEILDSSFQLKSEVQIGEYALSASASQMLELTEPNLFDSENECRESDSGTDVPFHRKLREQAKHRKRVAKRSKGETKLLSCAECCKSFKYPSALERHRSRHTGERAFSCLVCNKKFTDGGYVLSHMRKAHNKKDGFYSCEICDMEFTYKVDLKKHLTTHTSESEPITPSPLQIIEERRVETDPYALSCCNCGKKFQYSSTLKRHMFVHSEEKPFSCSLCEQKFTEKSQHLQNVHKMDDLFQCNQCDQRFTIKQELTEHIATHESEPITPSPLQIIENHRVETKPGALSCCNCDKKFRYSSALKRHMSVHSEEKPFGCSLCEQKFTQKAHVQQHHRVVHKMENFYQCDQCDQQFTFKRDLTEHIATHDPKLIVSTYQNTFECYMCHEVLETLRRLQFHMRLHWFDRVPCQLCGCLFRSTSAMNRHLVNHKRSDSERLMCDQCPKSFTTIRNLRNHLRNDHALRKYRRRANHEPEVMKCNICDKVFNRRTTLYQHKKIHSPNEKPHKCHICGWAFNQRSNLKKHILRHDGEYKVNCSVCHKSYSKGYMPEHMRTHTGEKRYQCSTCGKSFVSASALNTHTIVHTQEKKYQCDICPRSFTRSDKLLIHKRIHSGEFIYNCHQCKRGFAEKRSLKKHFISHHGVTLENGSGESTLPINVDGKRAKVNTFG